jgi:hypothetical protein
VARLISGKSNSSWSQAAPFAVVLGLVGILVVVVVSAAGPLAAFETESGVVSSGATKEVLASASGGQVVKFGAPVVTPTPTATPTTTPTPTATPVVYCSGVTPCYGKADLKVNGRCWGYIGTSIIDLTNYAPDHPGLASSVSSSCGMDVAVILAGGAAGSGAKRTHSASNTNTLLSGYKVTGAFDSNKP